MNQLPDSVQLMLAGRPITLNPGNVIKAGGEGRVHKISDTACKIYFPGHIDPQKRDKLRLLLGLRAIFPDNVAAPMDLLYDQSGIIQGYQMPLVPGKNLEEIQDPTTRHDPRVAVNIIEVFIHLLVTLQKLHGVRVIIGDLNPNNVMSERDKAYLIDFDSVQIMGYPCGVGIILYQDPLVLRNFKRGKLISDVFYNADSDHYAFATLLFEQLMYIHPRGGQHPDTNIPAAKSPERMVKGKIWAYSPLIIRPKFCREISWLYRGLANWFETYFTTDQRPAPTIDLLEAQIKQLGTVPKSRRLAAVHPRLFNHHNLTGNKMNIQGDARNLFGDCSSLQGHIGDLIGHISIWGKISRLRGNISKIRGDISGIYGDCSNISGEVTGLFGDVTNLSGDVTNIRGQISVSGNVSRLNGDISLLRGHLGSECRVWGDATGIDLDVSTHRGPLETIQYMLQQMGVYFGKSIATP